MVSESLRSVATKRSWEWLSFVASLPASPIQFRSLAAGTQLATGRYIVTGVNATNTATVAGVLTLHDGQDATGPIIGVYDLAAGAPVNAVIGTRGAMTDIGIFLEVSGGMFSGSVLVVPLSRYTNTVPGQ